MKIQEAISVLQGMLDRGSHTVDDELVIDFWSYEDVLVQDLDMSQEKARVIWSHVFDILDRCDNVDNDFVRDEITVAIAEYDEANEGA